jgi:hypothetical protein
MTLRVYEPAVTEDFEWVQPTHESDFDAVYQLDGRPRTKEWRPIRVRLLRRDSTLGRKTLKPAELPWLGGHALVCRPRAHELLAPILERSGEFLPLDLGGGEPLWLFNVCQIVDALDEAASDIVRFPSSGRVMDIRRHVFFPDRVAGMTAFRIPQSRSLFLGGEAVDAIVGLELSGARFELVWQMPPGGEKTGMAT